MLTAMVRFDADALVLTDGSVPVMVRAGGARDVGTRGMRRDVLVAVLKEVLPMHLQRAFDEVGAIKFAVPALTALPGHRFTVVASIGARLRVEIRRHRFEDALELPPADALWPVHARRTEVRPS
jgi:hypothetical protein